MTLTQKFLKFGAMVIGEARAKEQQIFAQEKRTKFGPLVVGDKVVIGTNTPTADSRPVEAVLSAQRTLDLLGRNPTMTLIYLEQEMRRAQPRRTVLNGVRDGLIAGKLQILAPNTAEAVIAQITATLDTLEPANK